MPANYGAAIDPAHAALQVAETPGSTTCEERQFTGVRAHV